MASMLPLDGFAIERNETVIKKVTIPFNLTDTNQLQSGRLDFNSDFKNVQIVDAFVDNGSISSKKIDNGRVDLTINNGKLINYKNAKTVTKTDTLYFSVLSCPIFKS